MYSEPAYSRWDGLPPVPQLGQAECIEVNYTTRGGAEMLLNLTRNISLSS